MMPRSTHSKAAPTTVVATRLSALAQLTAEDEALLRHAAEIQHRIPARREIVAEGEPVGSASIVLSGWACRVRHFADGRRQILSLIVPGDLIGVCAHPRPIATTNIVSLTTVVLSAAPPAGLSRALTDAYATSAAIDQACILRHVARLGRLSAAERMIDCMLELHERLRLAGMADVGRFAMPLTQETLADVLGLTSVHVNRTLQSLRKDDLLELRGGMAHLRNEAMLVDIVDYRPVRVSG